MRDSREYMPPSMYSEIDRHSPSAHAVDDVIDIEMRAPGASTTNQSMNIAGTSSASDATAQSSKRICCLLIRGPAYHSCLAAFTVIAPTSSVLPASSMRPFFEVGDGGTSTSNALGPAFASRRKVPSGLLVGGGPVS